MVLLISLQEWLVRGFGGWLQGHAQGMRRDKGRTDMWAATRNVPASCDACKA